MKNSSMDMKYIVVAVLAVAVAAFGGLALGEYIGAKNAEKLSAAYNEELAAMRAELGALTYEIDLLHDRIVKYKAEEPPRSDVAAEELLEVAQFTADRVAETVSAINNETTKEPTKCFTIAGKERCYAVSAIGRSSGGGGSSGSVS